jgi:hypothetical protein
MGETDHDEVTDRGEDAAQVDAEQRSHRESFLTGASVSFAALETTGRPK